jgi:hypothetical protein
VCLYRPLLCLQLFRTKESLDAHQHKTAESPKTAETKTSLSITSIGFEFGYQFIFWKRLALDMILLGPGVAGYNLKAFSRREFIGRRKAKTF